MSFLKNKVLFGYVIAAMLVYIITAFYSHGYYHADEHYQIIEFAGSKSGTHQPAELGWEYAAKIRPTLQPSIAFLSNELATLCGITNPYTQTLILRLLTGFLAIFAMTLFVVNTSKKSNRFTSQPFILCAVLFHLVSPISKFTILIRDLVWIVFF